MVDRLESRNSDGIKTFSMPGDWLITGKYTDKFSSKN